MECNGCNMFATIKHHKNMYTSNCAATGFWHTERGMAYAAVLSIMYLLDQCPGRRDAFARLYVLVNGKRFAKKDYPGIIREFIKGEKP